VIALEVDPARDPSPMNANQRMARIAVGAAIENLLRAAITRGWDVELVADPPRPALAVVRLAHWGVRPGRPEPLTALRVTNRRPYDGRPIPAEVLGRLASGTPDLDGVATRWIIGSDRLADLARTIGRADAAMFGEPAMRRAFLSKVRLDAAPGVPVTEGLCPASLDLSLPDRLALRAMGRAPDWFLRLAGVGRVFGAKARRLVAGSSGLCLIVARDDDEATDLLVGRAMQRAWLALTEQGLAAQPMMSLPVVENVAKHGDARLVESLGRDRLAALGEAFRAMVPELEGGRPAFLLRIGYAPPSRGRTSRLPLHAVATGLPAQERRALTPSERGEMA
jgi:hypothetical protein